MNPKVITKAIRNAAVSDAALKDLTISLLNERDLDDWEPILIELYAEFDITMMNMRLFTNTNRPNEKREALVAVKRIFQTLVTMIDIARNLEIQHVPHYMRNACYFNQYLIIEFEDADITSLQTSIEDWENHVSKIYKDENIMFAKERDDAEANENAIFNSLFEAGILGEITLPAR